MTALNSLQSLATPGVEKRPYEPSMEEILASIRRIIADDHSLPGRIAERIAPEADARSLAPEPVTSLLEDEPSLRSDRPPLANDKSSREPSPVSLLHPESKAAEIAVTAESEPTFEPVREPPSMRGTIAAPQFASPAGPHPTGSVDHAAPEANIDEPLADDEPVAFARPERPDPVESPDPVEVGHHLDLEGDDELAYDDSLVSKRGNGNVLDRDALLRDLDEEIRDLEQEKSRRRNLTAAPDALFSASTDHSVTAAFNALAATRLADNSEELLGIAREMIRPLLKAWIDDNMPSMVERMIRAEIERVARGGR